MLKEQHFLLQTKKPQLSFTNKVKGEICGPLQTQNTTRMPQELSTSRRGRAFKVL
jgi:hypothetical protein